MIKKDYLSEVEALYVQREALAPTKVPRLFVVWADVGQGVHGFVAVRESVAGDVVKFKPVTDIVALQNCVECAGTDIEFEVDYRKRKPEDLLWMIVSKATWKDEEAICAEEPTILEDALPVGEKGAFYVITSPKDVADAPITGVFRGKVGYMKLPRGQHADQHVADCFAVQGLQVEVAMCQELDIQDVIMAERDTLKGLRAAFKCGPATEWFEIPYPVGLDWNTFGSAEVAKTIGQYQQMGEQLP